MPSPSDRVALACGMMIEREALVASEYTDTERTGHLAKLKTHLWGASVQCPFCSKKLGSAKNHGLTVRQMHDPHEFFNYADVEKEMVKRVKAHLQSGTCPQYGQGTREDKTFSDEDIHDNHVGAPQVSFWGFDYKEIPRHQAIAYLQHYRLGEKWPGQQRRMDFPNEGGANPGSRHPRSPQRPAKSRASRDGEEAPAVQKIPGKAAPKQKPQPPATPPPGKGAAPGRPPSQSDEHWGPWRSSGQVPAKPKGEPRDSRGKPRDKRLSCSEERSLNRERPEYKREDAARAARRSQGRRQHKDGFHRRGRTRSRSRRGRVLKIPMRILRPIRRRS